MIVLQVVLEFPSNLAVTAADVQSHAVLGTVASSCSELVGLALWLLAEKENELDSERLAILLSLPVRSFVFGSVS